MPSIQERRRAGDIRRGLRAVACDTKRVDFVKFTSGMAHLRVVEAIATGKTSCPVEFPEPKQDGIIPPMNVEGTSHRGVEVSLPSSQDSDTQIEVTGSGNVYVHNFDLEEINRTSAERVAQRLFFNDVNKLSTLKLIANNRSDDKKIDRFKTAHPEVDPTSFVLETRSNSEEQRTTLYKKIEEGAYQAIAEDFDLSGERETRRTVLRMLEHADQSFNFYLHQLAGEGFSAEMRNEASFLTSLGEAVDITSSEQTTAILKSEVLRKLLLAYVSLQLEATDNPELAKNALGEVQKALNAKYYKGEPRGTERIRSETDSQNIVVAVEGINGTKKIKWRGKPRRNKVRAFDLSMRETVRPQRTSPDSGMKVYPNPDEKDHRASTIKAIRKAATRDEEEREKYSDEVIPVMDVQDRYRMEAVVFGDRLDALRTTSDVNDTLIDQLLDVSLVDDDGSVIPSIKDIIPDFEPGKSNGQALESIPRIQLKVEGLPFTEEVQVLDIASWEENKIHFGEVDPETGIFSGKGHPFYAARRANKIRDVLLSPALYGHIDIDTMIRVNQQAERERALSWNLTTRKKEDEYDKRKERLQEQVVFQASST